MSENNQVEKNKNEKSLSFSDVVSVVFSLFTKPVNKADYTRVLSKANRTETVEEYFAKTGLYAFIISLFVMSFSVLLFTVIFMQLDLTVTVDTSNITNAAPTIPDLPTEFIPSFIISIVLFVYSILTSIITFFINIIVANIQLVFQLIIMVLSFAVTFIIIYALRWYYPKYEANERMREINANLPYTITYMYSMTAGGRDVLTVFQKLAEQEEIYGESSIEARRIINRTRLGVDIQTAIIEHMNEVDGEFRDLLDELSTLMENSDNLESFFKRKTDDALYESEKRLESINSMLEILNEFILVLNSALPIGVVILAIVSEIAGGGMIELFYILPVMIFIFNGFLLLLMMLLYKKQLKVKKLQFNKPVDMEIENTDSNKIHESFNKFNSKNESDSFIQYLIEKPVIGLTVTLPITIFYIFILILNFDTSLIIDSPESFVLFYFYIPALILLSGYMILFEWKSYQIKKIRKDLRVLFNNIKDNNSQGLSLYESLDLETKNRSGLLYDEIKKNLQVYRLTPVSLSYSLNSTANKFDVSILRRTFKLLTDTIEQTNKISTPLTVITKDLENKRKIRKEKKSTANQTVGIMIISAIVMVIVFIVVDIMLLEQFESISDELGDNGGEAGGSVDFDDLDTPLIRASMTYTAVTVMTMIGIQTGYLRTNNISSGLKYVFILTGITLSVFLLV